MAKVTIFRGNFVNGLRQDVQANLSNYFRDERWVQDLSTRSRRDLETRLALTAPLALEDPVGDDLKDLENTIRVHKALKDLTPLQARDPRIWTRMTHLDAWSYMRKRWNAQKYSSDAPKAARYILTRYFVPVNESRALLRNGMARLWWTAHLTYDSNRDNPYELTAVLLASLDITQQILERNMGRSPSVLTGFLEFLRANRDVLLTRGEMNRTRIRQLAKFLNLSGGVCLLDSLNQLDIIRLLGEEVKRVMENEKEQKPRKVKKQHG